ncbi:Com family DNA-binding transcriptional regulator [Thalassovita gelatinovora]|nr:Com family DNA-binding transcriptional regulator [Thalassovita gelatinovora]
MEKEQRCAQCGRLLFKMIGLVISGSISIKCPRCRILNTLRPLESPSPKRPDRDGKEVSCGCLSHLKT